MSRRIEHVRKQKEARCYYWGLSFVVAMVVAFLLLLPTELFGSTFTVEDIGFDILLGREPDIPIGYWVEEDTPRIFIVHSWDGAEARFLRNAPTAAESFMGTKPPKVSGNFVFLTAWMLLSLVIGKIIRLVLPYEKAKQLSLLRRLLT